ncbi:ZG57-like protein [Mya arenaria]|uniref:ZG57-like protein n=1 Tax=Mya arenaria TaxID=6604 RepID=A0ABY7FX40_MYAAR|nr:ZG57-like protein [Mya arenaria]
MRQRLTDIIEEEMATLKLKAEQFHEQCFGQMHSSISQAISPTNQNQMDFSKCEAGDKAGGQMDSSISGNDDNASYPEERNILNIENDENSANDNGSNDFVIEIGVLTHRYRNRNSFGCKMVVDHSMVLRHLRHHSDTILGLHMSEREGAMGTAPYGQPVDDGGHRSLSMPSLFQVHDKEHHWSVILVLPNYGEVKMRTIKDPKKKPEIRRRGEAVPNTRAEAVLNTVPVEEDQATKCTPPKKRKTTKSQKDDSFNESGSVVDNQSDIVSERSSVIGDDDISDISSYKGTPPKKRNYNRIVEKSPETNIELNNDVHISPAETIKIKDSLKLSLEMKSPQDKKTTPEKKTKPRKKNKSGDSVLSDIHSSTPNDITQKKSPKSKKPVKQKTDSSEPIRNGEISITEKKKPGPRRKVKSDDIEESVPKKTTGRKRKLSGPQGEPNDKTETNAVKESGKKTTPTKRSKKPVSKTIDNAKKEEEKLVENCKTKPKRVRPKKATAKQVNKELEEIAESKKKEETSRLVTKDEEKDEIAEKPSDEPNDNITGIKESVKSNHRMLDLETDNEQSDVGSELETSFESVNSHRTDGDSVRNKPVDNDDENDEEDEEDHDENDEKMGDENDVPLEKHMEECQGRIPFKCPECSKEFQYESSLKCHVVSHYPDQPKLFSCNQCDYKSNYKANLKKHIRHIHEQRGERNIKCTECDKLFFSEDNMKRHLKLHSEERPYKCQQEECDKAFKTVNGLKTHEVSHQTDRPFPCEVEGCEKSFKTKRNLISHLNETHQNAPKNYKCEEDGCTMAFYKKCHLERHTDAHKASQKTSGTDPSNEMNEGVSTSANEKSPKKASANEVSLDRAVLSELPPRKAKKTDMYEFQRLLRKGYDKDKPPLPRIDTNLLPDIELPQAEGKPKKEVVEKPKKERKKPGPKPKPKVEKPEKPEKEVKEPEVSDAKKPRKRGRKRKSEIEPEADKTEEANEDEKKEKGVDEEVEEEEEVQKETGKKAEKKKTGKRGRSPKGKRGKSPKNIKVDDDDDDDDDDEEEGMPVKKKRGRKPKKDNSGNTGDKQEKVPKKRGRKSKAEKQALLEKDIEPENGDATINYSEVESSELFGDSKDSIADQFRTGNVSDSNTNVVKEFTVELSEKQNESEELKSENDESGLSKAKILDKSDEKRTSSSESSDIGSDFDEDLKPPPAPRPPPMYDSEDGDIESGPENEDFNISAMSNERVRDFESSREISREISRDFESSREIDDSVKTVSDHVHSVDTSTPKEHIHSVGTPASVNPYRNDSVNNELEHIHSVGTPASVNPYRNDSVNNEHEHIHSVGTPASVNPYRNDSVNNEYDNPLSHPDNPLSHPDNPLSHQDNPLSHQSHHSSVPHTPSHVSVPTTPATHEYQESRSIEPRSIEPRQTTDRIIKNPVQGQTNDENTDESSMPEVDKDYVGRFFEEIQCNSVPEITRMNSVEESKTPGKIVENPQSDSGVPSSLNSNQTDSSLQMQSPPADLSIKRMEMMSPERVPPDYVPRSESAHNRSSDRIQGVPSYDSQFTSQNPLEPYNPPLVAPTRETILRQPESNKPPSPSNPATNFMRFAETQRLPTPYDRNLQNLHRIAEGPLPQHNSSSPLLRPVPGRDDVFPGATGVAGSMARNPFHSSWAGQDVRPAHWAHPTYLQQQPGSTSSSLFGKDTYLPGREFMFDPSRAAERNMFTGLAAPPSHTQRPEIPHDTFQFDRFDLGSYFPPSLPVDYTRSAHSTSQKTLDERYRQTGSSVSDYRTLPPTSTGSDMFGCKFISNTNKKYRIST